MKITSESFLEFLSYSPTHIETIMDYFQIKRNGNRLKTYTDIRRYKFAVICLYFLCKGVINYNNRYVWIR